MPTPQNLSVEKSPKLWPLTSLIVALSGLSKPSFATHDVQHRYIITGYVTDAEGTLLAVTPVEMTLLGGQSAGEARSVRNGRYSIVVHAHNEAAGRRYWVIANGVTHAARFEFDPDNVVT